MQVIGVLDLLGGYAVHARGGLREHYAPVCAVADLPIEAGDALAVARAYAALGITSVYAADLESIAGRRSQDTLVAGIAGLGFPLWLDAGVSSVDHARRAVILGATRVVVGLETLPSFETLEAICSTLGSHRVAFSLDLRNGEPLSMNHALATLSAEGIGARAAEAGAGTLIVIDLARVGTGAGLDLELISRVRQAAPDQTLLAGGGVRGVGDLMQLAAAGCDGALVATALHNGGLTGADIRAAAAFS